MIRRLLPPLLTALTCIISIQVHAASSHHLSTKPITILGEPTTVLEEPIDTTWTENPLHAGQALHNLRQDTILSPRQKFRESRNIVARFFRAFNDCDSNYIQQSPYNMMVRVNHKTSAEWFSLRGENSKQQLNFMSERSFKLGPFLRWRFIGFGYAFDMTHLGKVTTKKTDMVVSFYSSMVGGDLMYRHTGNDFTLRGGRGFEQSLKPYRGDEFDGISINMMGISLYYIVNHKRFSLPAAFSQSSKQLRNAGSWKFGLSITQHNIHIDYTSLNEQISGGIESDMSEEKLCYTDYSFSAGYAYNWVFRRNWLLGIDFTPAIGYKRTSRNVWTKSENNITDDDPTDPVPSSEVDPLPVIGNDNQESRPMYAQPNFQEQYNKHFLRRGNINANITTRFAVVWNNNHYYGGLSLVLYNFNYRYRELSMNDTFFTMTLFTGLNFWKRGNKLFKRGR